MAYVATLQQTWVSGEASLVPTWVAPLEMEVFIDAGNVDPDTVIDNPTSSEPTVNLQHRVNAGDWRHLHLRVLNGEGKKPLFKADRTGRYTNSAPSSDYLPPYTQDFETWVYPSSRQLVDGSTGTIEWQYDDPFPAGDIYVATQPLGRQQDAGTFTARLLNDYSAIVSPTPSADASGVFHTSPSETQDSREVGQHDMYALQLRFGGTTTDGGPKRKLVVIAGIHAAGEAVSWLPFTYFIDYVLDSSDQAAQNIRANWDIDLYYNITPNGVFSGNNRTNPIRSGDPNRIWDTPNDEITATQAAILSDLDGGRFDCFFSWHAWSSETNPFLMYITDEEDDSETRSDVTQAFIDEGTTIFGTSPNIQSVNTSNTDVWWAMDNGATAAFDTETPQNGSTALSLYQSIGENWAKTLNVVDQQGHFVSGGVSVGTATETDTANTVTPSKTVSVGTATETDTAQSITVTKSGEVAVGTAVETDAANTVTPSKTVSVSAATETNTASSVQPTKNGSDSMATRPEAYIAQVLSPGSRPLAYANQ